MRKLKNQISLIMILLVVLVVFFIAITVGITFVNQTKGQVEELMTSNSTTTILSLNEYIEYLKKDITAISVGGSITDPKLSFRDRQQNIKTIKNNREDISSIYTINSNLISVNDASQEDIGEDYSGEYWAEKPLGLQNGEVYVDFPSYDKWSDNITLTVVYRMKSTEFDGLVCLDIHYDVIYDIVNQNQFGEDGYSMLFTSDGLIIAHPDRQLVLDEVSFDQLSENDNEFEDVVESTLNNTEGLITDVDYEGEEVMFRYQTVDQTGWKLVTVLNMAHYNETLYTEIFYIAVIGIISIIIAVITSIIVSRRIAGPIAVMSERMEKFAEGDLHSPMPDIKSKNEIGILNRSLKHSIESLSGYVDDISFKLESIAKGDISFNINRDYIGDFMPIKKSLNDILNSLNSVLSTIYQAAIEVDSTSRQMASSAQQLSANTVEKAGTTDELDVTFKSITENLKRTAQNTRDALERTSKVQSQIGNSASEMQEMLSSMEEITLTSSEIRKVIKSIDEIAFQTNILSLNAAVEAARAGNQGKGFAVVADEVRELANKSTSSAKESESLIKNSLRAVENGEETARKSWDQIKAAEILVNEVTKLVSDIEDMANKQAENASDVYSSIAQLNGIIQNDSAMSEENAGQSAELSMMASSLQKKLTFFKLRKEKDKN